jgi:sigma-B regulation protein RsbU (phosphoserine phosphatase)
MLKVGLGQAEDIDTGTAVGEAIRRCRMRLENAAPQAGIVFAAEDLDHRLVLQEIRNAFPGISLIGCTTAGELSSDLGFSDDSVSLTAFSSDTVSFHAAVARDVSSDPSASMRKALETLSADAVKDAGLCLMFPDPDCPAPEQLLQPLQDLLGREIPVFGGVAASPWESENPQLQFFAEEILTDAVPLMILSGDLSYAFAIANSWRPVGAKSTVTAVRGKEVRRIGDMSALGFYRHYLGPHTTPAFELPLAVYEDDSDRFYIRTPVSYDTEADSIVFPTAIREGATVQLTEATRDGIIDNTRESVNRLVQMVEGQWQPAAGMIFSCATRKQILGTRTREEIEILQATLPNTTAISGFYSFGELCPMKSGERTQLHHCTMVALLFGERSSQPAHPGIHPAKSASIDAERVTDGSSEVLRRERDFLLKKLKRSEQYRQRLEYVKDLNGKLLRRINQDINAARLEIQRKNELLRRTLELADEVQKNMLPRSNPTLPGLDIAGESVYCSETGGDYYDFLGGEDRAPHGFGVVVGDVSGHGIEAALLMTTVRALIRSRASQPGSLSDIVTHVNRQLAMDIYDTGHFMTLFYLIVDTDRKALHWVRAGHDPAILYDPKQDRFSTLSGEGLSLGLDPDRSYPEYRREQLSPGEIILVGTDGLWEARNPEGRMFGKAPLYEILRREAGGSAEQVLRSVMSALSDFREDREPEDDITLVVIRVTEDGPFATEETE